MPTFGYESLQSRHPVKWAECRRVVGAQMVAEGWNKHARKFNEVCRRRALRMLREVCA